MILARNIKNYKCLVLKDIRRLLSNNKASSSTADRKAKIVEQNGPSLKDFIQSSKSSESQLIDPSSEIENRIFLENLKRINEQIDENADFTQPVTKKAVYFEIHGCQMNLNDTEVAYSILAQTGRYYKCASEKEADVILIMTCSIREHAEQKIWNRLRELRTDKRRKRVKQIGVLGCMAERLKEKIVHQEKIVDVVCGPDSYRLLPSLLEQAERSGQAAINVQLSLDETYAEISPLRIYENEKKAFVSIQRGCDNMCSFCIVPFTRGRERSRPLESIVDEVKRLSDMGIREVTLLGQNVNSYCDRSFSSGEEIQYELSRGFKSNYKPKKGGGARFTQLLDAVSQVNPEMRVRFTSPHPKDFPDDLLHLMSSRPNIAKCIHLPAQSGSSTCLERMRRGYTREAYLDLVDKIRAIVPRVALTSDFIAGFCGESDQEHADTISLMRRVRYTYCFMYAYSMREKTKAYHRFADDVPAELKSARYLEMLETFRETSTQLNKSKIGEVHLVLVDQLSKRSSSEFSGRNDNNSLVVFPNLELPYIEDDRQSNSSRHPEIGDYVACRLLSATSQSFRAEPLFICKLQTFHRLNNNYEFLNNYQNKIISIS